MLRCCLLSGVCWLATAAAAEAALPGRDGAIAFDSSNEQGEDCGVGHDPDVFEPCTFTIHRISPTGRGQRRLSDCGTQAAPDCGDFDPAWSPNGRRIAYSSDGRVAIMHADGTHKRILGVSGNEPAWSPDGRRLVFRHTGTPLGIATVKTDGTGLRFLTESSTDGQPTWSVHGTIAFTRFRDDDQGIWTMTARGTRVRRLFARCGECDHADWSPGGRWLVFSSEGGLWAEVASASGAERHRLPAAVGGVPAWSPSGRRLAYAVNGDIYVIRTDGTGRRRIAKHGSGDGITGDHGSPSWQPRPR